MIYNQGYKTNYCKNLRSLKARARLELDFKGWGSAWARRTHNYLALLVLLINQAITSAPIALRNVVYT